MADRLIDLVTREARPALHLVVRRYGIPKGVSTGQQDQARRELQTALEEAYALGLRDGQQSRAKRYREELEALVGRIDVALGDEAIRERLADMREVTR
jgi:hypothetical protein